MSTNDADVVVLDQQLIDQVMDCTGASDIVQTESVQNLWSGFGQILRLHLKYASNTTRTIPTPNSATTENLKNAAKTENTVNTVKTPSKPIQSVIVKRIRPPSQTQHPRGWNTDTSEKRKLRSYEVEKCWYQHYAASALDDCPMPRLYDSYTDQLQTTLVLEDLDTRFPRRYTSLDIDTCVPCLHWLARFHACHLGSTGQGLWPTGSYWHLQTRADEFNVMADGKLKQGATALDAKLNKGKYQTLVHGDAKVANVCFSTDSLNVAMVDFQYVGRGCGMRDVAYFLGSCLSETECEQYADELLAMYFAELTRHVHTEDKVALESEWRALYSTAWADFHRFLAGWMPEHNKINGYMQRMTDDALARL